MVVMPVVSQRVMANPEFFTVIFTRPMADSSSKRLA